MGLFESAAFRISVADSACLKPSGIPEIAFVGRSNAGKSTTINTLTRQRQLAFASKTPGRTQLLNFFTLSVKNPDQTATPVAELVDLPGYGFSKAAPDVRSTWSRLAIDYLLQRENLAGVVVVMDARRPFMPADEWVIGLLGARPVKIHFLLNKCDQLRPSERTAVLNAALERARELGPHASAQFYSGLKKTGIPELQTVLEHWINREELVASSLLT